MGAIAVLRAAVDRWPRSAARASPSISPLGGFQAGIAVYASNAGGY